MPRILVIDDDRDVRAGVVNYLKRMGHEVVEASDGALGMKEIRAQAFDVVITDINMPDKDGIEVISELQDASDGCPVIAMSGGGLFAKELLLKNAEMLGAMITLEKPFDLTDLGKAIQQALESSSRR